jgi:hypothetical protein
MRVRGARERSTTWEFVPTAAPNPYAGATPGLPPVSWWACTSEQSVARDGPCAGEGPDDGGHVTGERHHDVGGRLPPRRAVSAPLAQAPWCGPPDRLEGLWEGFHPPWERAAALGRRTRRPGPRAEGAAGDRVAGLGAGPLAAACATGGRPGRASQLAHARSGVVPTGQVAACGDARAGHGALDAAPRPPGLRPGSTRRNASAGRAGGRHVARC